jgi:hypothetical protein
VRDTTGAEILKSNLCIACLCSKGKRPLTFQICSFSFSTVTLDVPLEDLYRGKKVVTKIRRQIVCPICHGSGARSSKVPGNFSSKLTPQWCQKRPTIVSKETYYTSDLPSHIGHGQHTPTPKLNLGYHTSMRLRLI